MPRDSSWYHEAALFCLANPLIQQYCLSKPNRAAAYRYPSRLLRYWFMHQLLQQEGRQHGALSICEIGVDRGQMLYFARQATAGDVANDAQPWLAGWDAVDVHLRKEELQAVGYRRQFQLDLECDPIPPALQGQYDVVILLHVLEHLQDPEAALGKALQCLKPGGIVIGGMPVLPQALLGWREGQLRRKARRHGHVSAFSPLRVRAWAERFGLQEEFCRGAFFLRSKRLPLENYRWWVRCNLGFGALFPAWPGEIYWSFRTSLRSSVTLAAASVTKAASQALPGEGLDSEAA